MSLACDGAPVTDWKVPWNSVGPYEVDSWRSSFGVDMYLVVGKHGHQLHTERGSVITITRQYADAVCEAANAGVLARDEEPANPSTRHKR